MAGKVFFSVTMFGKCLSEALRYPREDNRRRTERLAEVADATIT